MAAAACQAPGDPQLASLVSPGGTYVIRLSGHPSTPVFFEHPVRAEVYKNGTLHVPARQIFVADVFETAFEKRFDPPLWAAPNTLRFPAKKTAGQEHSDTLTVRNAGGQPFRSIRIETGNDLFLIVDLAPRAELVFPFRAQPVAGKLSWFDVIVDAGAGEVPLRGSGAFGIRPDPGVRYAFSMSISPNGVEFAETGGRAELYR